jgi:hypothetical protein
MIGTINNWVTKVVSTVSGPLHTWGPKTVKKAAKACKCRKTAKYKGKKCRCG